MQSDEPPSPSTSIAPPSSGRRIRVRSIKRPSLTQEVHRLPSAPSDDNDWVSPFTLPPLPTLKSNRAHSNLNRSPDERLHNRSASSAYYAAAWGSPYATPSPTSSPAPRATRNRSLDLESSSPLVSRSAAKSYIDQSSGRSRNFSVPSIDATSPSAVRSNLATSEEGETLISHRRNWLSESDGSDNETAKAFEETPTKLNFIRSQRPAKVQRARFSGARTHQLQESVATITPETFNGSSSPQLKERRNWKPLASMDTDMADLHPAGQELESPEKPLPSLPMKSLEDVDESIQTRPTLPPPVQSFQRPKKKVVWNGKSCIIALPLADRISSGLPPLLTAQEIRDRMQRWTDLGYPINGFTVGTWDFSFLYSGGVSRSTFPDPDDMYAEHKNGNVRVRIPDQAEWDAWVEYLKEEKLRALGVTPSNSEAPASSQSPFSAMSRVSSTYPSMTASPPVPTMSAASNQGRVTHSPFSPSMSAAPVVVGKPQNPTQGNGMPQSVHAYRQSMAVPNLQHRMSSPFDYPISQPSNFGPGMRSPPDQFGRRQFSPGHTQNLQSMGHILSPTGFPDNGRTIHSNPQVEQIRRQQEMLVRQQQQFQTQIAQHHRQMSMFPLQSAATEHLPRTPVAESPVRHTPEIMHPTPRSHRHNLSAALEQGMQNSTNLARNVEASINNEAQDLEHATREPIHEDANMEDENAHEELPILARPEILKESDEKSEIETNPSLAGTPFLPEDRNPFANLQSLGEPPKNTSSTISGHVSRPSASKLNVEAKEFNPSGAFQSSNFTFGESTFAPTFNKQPQPFGFAMHKNKDPSITKFNVAAPEFTPSFLKQSTTSERSTFDESVLKSAVESTPEKSVFDPRSSTFSFTSASFNVDAPEFKPSRWSNSTLDFTPEKQTDFKGSIFGDVVIEPNTKVTRRTTNKALPIVRPTSKDGETDESESDVESRDDEEAESDEEDGRPTVPIDRQKRARTFDSDGDQLPLFADSAPFTSFADAREQTTDVETKEQVNDILDATVPLEDRTIPDNNMPTDEATEQEISPSIAPLVNLESDQENMLPKVADINDQLASETGDSESQIPEQPLQDLLDPARVLSEVEEDNPREVSKDERSSSLERTEKSNEPLLEANDLKATLPATVPIFQPSQQSESLLSATAEPFVFKPSATEFKPQETKASLPTPKKPQGLMASRFAQISSPDLSPPQQAVKPQSEEHVVHSRSDGGESMDIPIQVESFEPQPSAFEISVPEDRINANPGSQEHHLLEKFREDQPHSPSLASMPGDISLEEINAVMKEFEDNPDLGVIREDSPIQSTPLIDMRFTPNFRSDAPSPSPRRSGQVFEHQPPTSYGGLNLSGVHQLNYGSGDISDWNNELSPRQQDKLEARAHFFDDHINDLVDNVLENRLAPLERALQEIHQSVATISTVPQNAPKSTISNGNKDSDADDEDEVQEIAAYRSRSPQRRERKQEQIRSMIMEAFTTHIAALQEAQTAPIQKSLDEMNEFLHQSPREQPAKVDMTDIQAVLEEMRSIAQKEPSRPEVDLSTVHEMLREIQLTTQAIPKTEQQTDVKAIFEDVLLTHPRFQEQSIQPDDRTAEKMQLKIDELEAMLRASEKRADGEAALRREAEDEVENLARRLKEAEDSVSMEREASESAQRSLETFVKEKQDYRHNNTEVEELRLKCNALESTLDEYRKSSDQWREEIRDEREKTKQFARALQEVKDQYEDRLESRSVLRAQIERLQHRISQVMEDVHHDEAEWRKREHDLTSKNQLLQSALDHETNRRARIELDADRLRKEHKDGLQYKAKYEHAQHEMSRLASVIVNLQTENRSHQDASFQAQRELAYLKEHKDHEVASAIKRLQSDLDASNNTVDNIREESGAQISRLRSRLESAEEELDDQRSKHNHSVSHMAEAHNRALEEVGQKHDHSMSHMVEAHNRALDEVGRKHDAELERLQIVHDQKLKDLHESHARKESNLAEDRDRLEQQMNEQLALSADKVRHLEIKASDLEERLEVTKSAARAAVEAATAKGVNLPTPASSVVASPPHRPSITSASIPLVKGSDLPEKISPQALRESILVLQDQLQNREQRIEKLEAEIGIIDKEAPAKLKERDTEITMLRELLEVRLEDLQELITALEKPDYDRSTVKDAAIRLKTQMKMEQQLKERVISGTGLNNLPSSITSGLVNLTQSPRAMVAAAAWGNWRKVRDTGVSAVTDFASNLGSQTPSRAGTNISTNRSIAMTSPTASLKSSANDSVNPLSPPTMRPLAAAAAAARRGANPLASSSSTEGARPLRAFSSQPRTLSGARKLSNQGHSRPGSMSSIVQGTEPSSIRVEPPSTPQHLRAESDFGDDVDEDASPLDGKDRGFDVEEDDDDEEATNVAAPESALQLVDEDVVEVIEEE